MYDFKSKEFWHWIISLILLGAFIVSRKEIIINDQLTTVDKIVITPEGKKFSLYHSVLKSINVRYESNNVFIEAEENFDTVKRVVARFYSLE